MSYNYDSGFDNVQVKDYSGIATLALQRFFDSLGGTVSVVNNVMAASYEIPRESKLGPTSARNRENNINRQQPVRSNISIPLKSSKSQVVINEEDLVRIKYDPKETCERLGLAQLARERDDKVLDAFNAVSDSDASVTVASASSGMTLDKLLKAKVSLENDYAPSGEPIYCGLNPIQFAELMKIDQFTKGEYLGYNDLPFASKTAAYASRALARTYTWNGIWFIKLPGDELPKSGNDRTNYLWVKRSTFYCTAPGNSVVRIVPDNIQEQFVCNLHSYHGSKTIYPKGLAKIKATES